MESWTIYGQIVVDQTQRYSATSQTVATDASKALHNQAEALSTKTCEQLYIQIKLQILQYAASLARLQ
jgi:hypothetical protein